MGPDIRIVQDTVIHDDIILAVSDQGPGIHDEITGRHVARVLRNGNGGK